MARPQQLQIGSILAACFLLYWFGADLVAAWGAKRVVTRYLALALAVNALVALASLPWAEARGTASSSVLPVAEAAAIAWAFAFPKRELRLYFVLPLQGVQVAWLMGAITLLLVPSRGVAESLPHLVAVGGAIAWYAAIEPRLRVR